MRNNTALSLLMGVILCLLALQGAALRAEESRVFDEATLDRLAPRLKERVILFRFNRKPELDPLKLVETGYISDQAFYSFNHATLPKDWAQTHNVKPHNQGSLLRRMTWIARTHGRLMGRGIWSYEHHISTFYLTERVELIEIILEPGVRVYNSLKAKAPEGNFNIEDPTVMPAVHREGEEWIVRTQAGVKVRALSFKGRNTSTIVDTIREVQHEKEKFKNFPVHLAELDRIIQVGINELKTRKDIHPSDMHGIEGGEDLIMIPHASLAELRQEMANPKTDPQSIANYFFVRNRDAGQLAQDLKSAIKNDQLSIEEQRLLVDVIDQGLSSRTRRQYKPLDSNVFSAELQAHYQDSYSEHKFASGEVRRALSETAAELLASKDETIANRAIAILDISRRYGYGAVTVNVEAPVTEAINNVKDSIQLLKAFDLASYHSATKNKNVQRAMKNAVKRVKLDPEARRKAMSTLSTAIFYSNSSGEYGVEALKTFINMTLSEDAFEKELGFRGLDIYAKSTHGMIPMLKLGAQGEIPLQILAEYTDGVENGIDDREPYIWLGGVNQTDRETQSFYWTLALPEFQFFNKWSTDAVRRALESNPPPINLQLYAKLKALSKKSCEEEVTTTHFAPVRQTRPMRNSR